MSVLQPRSHIFDPIIDGKLEGGKFTVCVTPAGSAESDRPKDFTTNDTTNVIFVFERVKEKQKP